MKTPGYLKKGDTIAIISPAGRIDKNIVLKSKEIIEDFGFKVVIGDNAFNQYYQYAGREDERAKDFNNALKDDNVKAILFSRGGYGSLKIFDSIDFNLLKSNPKWLIGFSDITVFHRFVNNMGIESLHASMPKDFNINNPLALKKTFNVLTGHNLEYSKKKSDLDIPGSVNAVLTGGNLSILYSLRGTSLDYDLQNKILFIEEVGEYLYHLDRMMMNFKYGSVFEKIKGLIVGGMTDMKDNRRAYGMNANEIIYNYVKDYDFPVMFNFPAGHISDNYPLIMGREINFRLSNDEGVLNFKS